MKAEELFVGALVRVNRDGLCIKKDTIVEVRAVDADDKLIEKGLVGSTHCRPLDDNQFDGGIWCEFLDPIPLTPEILKRNGFILTEVGDNGIATPRKNINRYEKHECKTKWRDIIMWYDRITKKWCLHGINSIQLNYIHELQHALRLCQIDKTIEL